MEHEITLSGCDDSTSIKIDLTEIELRFLKNIAEKLNDESTYGCMPRMLIDNEYPTSEKVKG